MDKLRGIRHVSQSVPTREGAGVRLKRVFGFQTIEGLDPFLLLDDFHSDNPDHYIAGFPWHPHRGIETITYVLQGTVEHGDSLGNHGAIGPGDVQWMTAGSGIVHQEMPKGRSEDNLLWGLQLWANLPATQKMMDPAYRDVTAAHIPEVETKGGGRVKIIAGSMGETDGPVQDIITEPQYLDITLPPGGVLEHPIERGHNAFAYILAGSASADSNGAFGPEHLLVLDEGDKVKISAREDGARFLLVSGKPIGEPVAWHGPIVMNTQEELELAYLELREGVFIK